MRFRLVFISLCLCLIPLNGCQSLSPATQSENGSSWQLSKIFGEGVFLASLRSNPAERCASIHVVEELNSYFELPENNASPEQIGFSNAQIMHVEGHCFTDDERLMAEVKLHFEVIPGPFVQADTNSERSEFPFFIAVVDAEQKILYKKLTDLPVEFGNEPVSYKDEVLLDVNISAPPDEATIMLIAGFQLTEAQYAYASRQKMINIQLASGTEQPDPLVQ